MPPGVILGVSALVGAGASILGAKSNNKAINKATDAQTASTAEQTALQRDIYGQNKAALSPFMQRGNVAGDTIMAALGLGGTATAPQAGLPTPALAVPYNGGYPDAAQYPGYAGQHPWLMQQGQGALGQQQVGAPGTTAQPGQSPQQAATNAYEMFKQSTGYQTRFGEGMRALNAGYAGAGVVQSGAAQKAALRFGQDFASNEFGNWMGYLGNQQGVGFAGASALSGVGQGFADRMGDISQNNANATAQAAALRAQNKGALYTGLAGIAGGLTSYIR
jgi:hypothetical protein